MFMSPEQYIDSLKDQLDALVGLSQESFSNLEKAVKLNMSTAKSVMNDGAGAIESVLSVKDVQELVTVSSSVGQPIAERAVDYWKALYTLSSSMSADAAKLLEGELAKGNKSLVELLDSAGKNAPAGSESAVAFMKSAISAANSAYDTVSKAAKQAVELAETNVATATTSVVKATKASAKKAA